MKLTSLVSLLSVCAMVGFTEGAIAFKAEEAPRDFDQHQQPQDYPEFFMIEQAMQAAKNGFSSALQMAEDFTALRPSQAEAVNGFPLLKWRKYPQRPENPSEAYNRKKHFSGWRKTSENCLNTRAFVLKRDSVKDVQFRDSTCTITGGEWNDPYTGQTFRDAGELDIDHFVPLKNAYLSGGWKWPRNKFCRYGNFLKNTFHLLSVSGRENRRKGDGTPSDYMPPNREYQCEYVTRWLKIKTIWGLIMMPPEAQAIQNIIRDNNCDPNKFQITMQELSENRRASETDPVCD